MSSRNLSDWLSGYIKYTDNSEPPKSYHVWTGLSLIAGALQRRVYLRWGYETIYPNLYVVLVGPSGRTRKGTAMGIGRDLVKDIGISLTSESVTREALIRAMKRSVSTYIEPDTSIPKFHCSLTTISPELSVFLGQGNIKFLADLTDWYDSNDRWKYETKNAGTDEIQGVCFNFLGATAPDWLQSILPQEAIGGGFTSRVIFITEEQKRKTVSEYTLTEEDHRLHEALRADLERIVTIAGEMVFTEEAAQMYKSWYEEQDIKVRKGIYPIEDPLFIGYCERRPTHIRKLSMIFSASRGDDLLMTADDFERALKVLLKAEIKMKRTFRGIGAAPNARVTEQIISFIGLNGSCTRDQVLMNFYRDVDLATLQTIEETLEAMKVIKLIRTASGTRYEFRK